MISLAAGLGALLILKDTLGSTIESIKVFLDMANVQSHDMQIMLKAAGLTILCELGVQICCDAGESALAGRIRLACRMAMLSMAMPFIMQIIDSIALFS